MMDIFHPIIYTIFNTLNLNVDKPILFSEVDMTTFFHFKIYPNITNQACWDGSGGIEGNYP